METRTTCVQRRVIFDLHSVAIREEIFPPLFREIQIVGSSCTFVWLCLRRRVHDFSDSLLKGKQLLTENPHVNTVFVSKRIF